MALSTDGTTVLAAGDNRLELWRSDMVRMISYGALDAQIKPGVPGPVLCPLESAAASTPAVSVLEACPDQAFLRLTLLRPAKEEDTPDLKIRTAGRRQGGLRRPGGRGLRNHHRRLRPAPRPSLKIVDETGSTTADLPLPKPVSPHGRDPAR